MHKMQNKPIAQQAKMTSTVAVACVASLASNCSLDNEQILSWRNVASATESFSCVATCTVMAVLCMVQLL
jgi:hypothetical protein